MSQVIFSAGSSSYNKNKWGLASLVNSLLAEEGTTKHNADQIAIEFDRMGAQYRGNVDRDMAAVSLHGLTKSNYLKPALNNICGSFNYAEFFFGGLI